MNNNLKVSVSYICSDYKETKTISLIDESNADYIHVDLMDGHFVPEKNFTMGLVTKELSLVTKPLDVHLMVDNPLKYIEDLAMLNTLYITFHLEIKKDINKVIEAIKNLGIKVGIAIKPDTSVKDLIPYLDKIDQVLVMSVEPGEGGQEFMPDVLTKLEELNSLKEQYNFIISIDGGINDETIKLIKDYNLDMIVSGSFVCKSNNFNKQIELLKKD